jgi:hypothetical protein
MTGADDLRDAIAVLFRRKGRAELSEKEFVLSASMDFRWFPPKDAQRLLQRGLESGLVRSEAGVIRPTFDVESIETPREFSPSPGILEEPPAPLNTFLRIVDAIVDRTHEDRRAVIAAINAIQERMEIDLEVAALVAARKAGLDIRGFVGSVEKRLVAR